MKDESPKWKRQVHLSTLVVMSVVAGLFMSVQRIERRLPMSGDYFTVLSQERQSGISEEKFLGLKDRLVLVGYAEYIYGWPARILWSYGPAQMDLNGDVHFLSARPFQRRWSTESIVFNGIIGLLLMYGTGWICERRIRTTELEG